MDDLAPAGLSHEDVCLNGWTFERGARFEALFSHPSGWGFGVSREARTRMLILCAEPGMGKSYLIREILEHRDRLGQDVRLLDLSVGKASYAPKALGRIARQAEARRNSGEGMTLAIDNLPPADECDAMKEARALRRIADCGCDVIIGLRPEASGLCEVLPEACCLHSADLCIHGQLPDAKREAYKKMTHGIPVLVEGLYGDPLIEGEPLPAGRYQSALSDLVRSSLRASLVEEERRLRLAMFLLGCGSLADLRSIVGKADDDALMWLRRDAPLFGISPRADAFCCSPLLPLRALDGCADALACAVRTIDGGRQVAHGCACFLAERGDYQRLARICALDVPSSLMGPLIEAWSCELVAIGEGGLVRRAERDASAARSGHDGLATESAAPSMPHAALLVLGARPLSPDAAVGMRGQHGDAGDAWQERGPSSAHLLLMRRARSLRASANASWLGDPGRTPDDLARGLACHLKARSLLLAGRFTDAYGLLVNSPDRQGALGLISALLSDDFEIAGIMAGEVPDAIDRRGFQEARSLIKRAGGTRLAAYREVLEPCLAVLSAGADAVPGIERACARAEASGDRLTQAAFLLVAAAADMRRGVTPRAHVRASQACGLAKDGGCAYLAQCAALLDCAARIRMGDDEALSSMAAWRGKGSAVMDLWRMLACSLGAGATKEPRLDVVSRTVLPANAAWLIGLLASGCGKASGDFRESLPEAWLEALERRHEGMGALFGVEPRASRPASDGVCLQPSQGLRPGPSRPASDPHRVRINVLGTFEVLMDGEPVDPRKFQRRKARELLLLLCFTSTHKVRRYEALDSIWGTTDYVNGIQRIYDAASVVRCAVGAREHGCDPLVSSKGEGTIALNGEVVRCDVDDFCQEAALAISDESDDLAAMRHACRMWDRVPGGFDAAFCACPLMGSARGRRLRDLYVDAAIAGSDAALRLGRAHIAARLADGAHEADGLREDAAISLLNALGALGRTAEARRLYDDVSRTLINETKMPPSQSLREAAEKALSGDAGGHGTMPAAG